EGVLLPDGVAVQRPAGYQLQATLDLVARESGHGSCSSKLRSASPHLIQPYACGLERVERFALQLEHRRLLAWGGKRRSGHRAMVRAFGLLKRGQRRRVFMLPVEPRKETVGCLGFGGAGAFDAEADVRIGPLGRRDPA